MAAGQHKKRLHASSVVSCDLQEQCGAKKKRDIISPHNFLNMKAHISLEWDEIQQKVVARKEQIGITWRKLGPFVNTLVPRHSALADVFSIPHEVFGLEDLTEVLSYEVWKMRLSETEKIFLSQFLPKGADVEQVVESLLNGDNFHFGNPFLKWAASLCSGKLHPDAILNQEQQLAAYKKAYNSELHKYHNEYLNDKITEDLQKLKETWIDHEGAEWDVIEKMWRNRYAGEYKNTTPALERPKVVASSRREGKSQKLYIRSANGAKYMSYFKITKKQHQLLKKMKQPDGIKSKCLDHVLGDIRSFQVQPYEVYEEEERKKLHEHWLRLANRDIPSSFRSWTERSLQRQNWRMMLEQEVKDSKSFAFEEEESDRCSLLEELDSGEADELDSGEVDEDSMDTENSEDDNESASRFRTALALQPIPSLNGDRRLEPMKTELEEDSEEIFESECASPVLSKIVRDTYSRDAVQGIPSLKGCYDIQPINPQSDEGSRQTFKPEISATILPKFFGDNNAAEFSEQKDVPDSAKRSVSYSTNSQPLQQIASPKGHHGLDSLDIKFRQNSQDVTKPNNSMPFLSQFTGNINLIDDNINRQGCPRSAEDPWLEVGLPDSNHRAHVNHGYSFSSDLSLGQPHLNEDIRSGFQVVTGGSFVSSYTNQDHDKLFQPVNKKHGLVPSQVNHQKQGRLQFLGAQTVLPEPGHHPGHFQEQQQQLLEQRQQTSDGDYYMNPIIHKNLYSYNGSYPLPSQEIFSHSNMQNWTIDPTQVSAPLHSFAVGQELLSESTTRVQQRGCGGWSGVDVSSASESMGNVSNADGSLYSVLSEFHNIMSTSEQSQARNAALGGNSDVYPHTGHQLNYSSGCEGPANLKANNVSWTNSPHQSSGLHDSVGKMFLRSWNM